MKRAALTVARGAALTALIACAALLAFRANRVLRIATGAISHTLCSAAFVQGLDPTQVYAETFATDPHFGLINWSIRYQVDSEHREVRTTLGGAFASRAVYRGQLGCLLLRGDPPPSLLHSLSIVAPRYDDLAPAEPVAGDAAVRRVLERAFALHPASQWLKAMVVLRDGKVVAEYYAPGYGPNTPLLGWSLTKSVTAALIGILVRQGRLTPNQPAPVPEWNDPGDARHAITIDELLRMTSGLDFPETHSGFDSVSRMAFLERDMAGFAARARLKAKPGTTWAYSSGNYIILSRIIRDAGGGEAAGVLDLVRRELFEPLEMKSATFEMDATGTPIGSTYMFATARDWARFGTVYLNDGVVNGRRILPSGWVLYSTTPTLNTTYGVKFQLADRHKRQLGVPADALFSEGFLGQELAIVPSERIVIARFGVIHDHWEDLDPIVPAVISALHSHDGK